MSEFKNFRETKEELSEKETFKKMEIKGKDLLALKSITLSEKVSISSLVNLVLRFKNGNVIKEENREELILREYINENNDVTDKGVTYINSEEVKDRLNKLIEDE